MLLFVFVRAYPLSYFFNRSFSFKLNRWKRYYERSSWSCSAAAFSLENVTTSAQPGRRHCSSGCLVGHIEMNLNGLWSPKWSYFPTSALLFLLLLYKAKVISILSILNCYYNDSISFFSLEKSKNSIGIRNGSKWEGYKKNLWSKIMLKTRIIINPGMMKLRASEDDPTTKHFNATDDCKNS